MAWTRRPGTARGQPIIRSPPKGIEVRAYWADGEIDRDKVAIARRKLRQS
jgi:hypothetical protein